MILADQGKPAKYKLTRMPENQSYLSSILADQGKLVRILADQDKLARILIDQGKLAKDAGRSR